MKHSIMTRVLAAGTAALMLIGFAGCQQQIAVTSEYYEDVPGGGTAGNNESGTTTGSDTVSGGTTSPGNSHTGDNSTGGGTQPPVESFNPTPPAGGNGFNGATVTISHWGVGLKPSTSSSNYKQYQQLVSDIEKKYNCKLEFPAVADSISYGNSVLTAGASGTSYADLVYMPSDQAYPNAAIKGYFKPLDNLLDLKSLQWNQTATNDIMPINGKHYFVAPAIGASQLSTGGFFFNKKVFDTLGVEYPYEHVDSNTWTWDTFRDMMKRLTRKVNNVQYYGLANLPVTSFISSIGSSVTKMVNGKCTLNLENEQTYEAIQFVSDLYNVDKVVGTEQLWEDGFVGMIAAAYYNGDDYMELLGSNNVGYVYTPRHESMKDYNVVGGSIEIVGIMTGNKKDEKLLAQLLTDFTAMYDWRPTAEQVMEAYMGDAQALEIAVDQSERAYNNMDLRPAYPFLTKTVMWGDWGIKEKKSPQAYIAEIKNAAQDDINAMWGYK